jgi:hypothetical protein
MTSFLALVRKEGAAVRDQDQANKNDSQGNATLRRFIHGPPFLFIVMIFEAWQAIAN